MLIPSFSYHGKL
jgi:hypothetical protein